MASSGKMAPQVRVRPVALEHRWRRRRIEDEIRGALRDRVERGGRRASEGQLDAVGVGLAKAVRPPLPGGIAGERQGSTRVVPLDEVGA
jgi:hypothetical protein